MNRRFMDPKHVALAGASLAAVLHEEMPEGNEPWTSLRYCRQAMATTFEVVLPLGTTNANAAATAALDRIDALEDQLSVYREHSEVSELNRRAAREPVQVADNLFQLLQLAQRVHHATAGAHDVTAGSLIRAWGFLRGPKRVPTKEERLAALRCVGMQHVQLDTEQRTVRFYCQEMEINLGSIGKGWALDEAAALFQTEFGIGSGLLQGGQSSVYAMGSQPGSEQGWAVDVRHPRDHARTVARLWLRNRGLGTSAATRQYLEWQGRRLGHLLDPRTGWPAEGIASVTVTAPTAAEADALSTAFYVLGPEKTREFCAAHPGIGVLLIPADHPDVPTFLNLD